MSISLIDMNFLYASFVLIGMSKVLMISMLHGDSECEDYLLTWRMY